MSNIITEITKEQLRTDMPAFRPGDTVSVNTPKIAALKVTRRGKVRRAKLYYLRNLRGKAARIKEIR